MVFHDDPSEGGGFGQRAGRGASRLPQSISELRAGQRTLTAMLMNLFDELEQRRLQLAAQSRGLAAERSPKGTNDGGSRAADEQILALERALAAAQSHHAQCLAEFAVTRIELATARIELRQAAGPRAIAADAGPASEPDTLSAELETLRSSAVELARELSENRRRVATDPGGLGGNISQIGPTCGAPGRPARLIEAAPAAVSPETGADPLHWAANGPSRAGGDQLPEPSE